MKARYDASIKNKDQVINSQRESNEQMTKENELLRKKCKQLKKGELNQLQPRASVVRRVEIKKESKFYLRRQMWVSWLYKCEDSLLKCNACGIWVCETCNDVQIAKLKPMMNKCFSIYFACKRCATSLQHSREARTQLNNANSASNMNTDVNKTGTDMLASLKIMFEDKVS